MEPVALAQEMLTLNINRDNTGKIQFTHILSLMDYL
jgi:hypothetical protein